VHYAGARLCAIRGESFDFVKKKTAPLAN